MNRANRLVELIETEYLRRADAIGRKTQLVLNMTLPLEENIREKQDFEIDTDEWRDISALHRIMVKVMIDFEYLHSLYGIHSSALDEGKEEKEKKFDELRTLFTQVFTVFEFAQQRNLQLASDEKEPEKRLVKALERRYKILPSSEFYGAVGSILSDQYLCSELPGLPETCISLLARLSEKHECAAQFIGKYSASETLSFLEAAFDSMEEFH